MEYILGQDTVVGFPNELDNSIGKSKLKERIRLTKRDVEILVFLLEMKFCSLDELYFKFFRLNLDGTESKSSWWARDKINILKSFKLVTSVHFYTEAKSYYLATRKALRFVSRRSPKQERKFVICF